MKTLSRFNRSPVAAALVLGAIFLLLLFCTHETDLVADDYRYCFSFADDSRIESVSQIIPSMAAHRQSMNGRVIAHFLVQLFLLLPKTAFDLLNALCFTALVWLIVRPAERDREANALLRLCVFGFLWLLQPDFGQTFLWLDGSINYLWGAVLSLLWLLPWSNRFLTGREPARPIRVLFVPFSFLVGAYSENATVALVAMALCFLLLERLTQKQKPRAWTLLSLAAMLFGFFFMMLAPAESVNKSAELRLAVLFSNFIECGRYYLRFWPALLSFALLFFLTRKDEATRKTRVLSLVYLFGSLAGHFVLTFAMYTAGRSTYMGLILLLAANALLFVPLWESERRRLLAVLCAFCLLCTGYQVVRGVQDIRRTHTLLRYNVEFITARAAEGETVIQVPRPYAGTGYSALEGLAYLNTEDPDDWPNVYMAKYFGVDSIIAY